jgi:hypothetical protein
MFIVHILEGEMVERGKGIPSGCVAIAGSASAPLPRGPHSDWSRGGAMEGDRRAEAALSLGRSGSCPVIVRRPQGLHRQFR